MVNDGGRFTIRDEGYWIYVTRDGYHTPKDWSEHGGKLMAFGDEYTITFLMQNLTAYPEIQTMKYAPPLPGMGYKTWALMVYCLDREADTIWPLLQKEGVARRLWKYDKQTYADWEPNGRLSKRRVSIREGRANG